VYSSTFIFQFVFLAIYTSQKRLYSNFKFSEHFLGFVEGFIVAKLAKFFLKVIKKCVFLVFKLGNFEKIR